MYQINRFIKWVRYRFFTLTIIYLKHKFLFGGSGMRFRTYLWIRRKISTDSLILELGGGYVSTRWLSSRYQLYTIENNPKFLWLFDSNYIFAPISNGWYDIQSIVSASLPPQVSLIIVDGPAGEIGRREVINKLDLLPKFDYLLIDDTNRISEKALARDLANKYKLNIEFHDCFTILSKFNY